MGRRASSPPSDHPVAGLVLPSVVGTGPPHHAVRREPAGQSKARGAPGLSAHGTTHGLTGSRVPATGPRRGGTARPRPEPVLLAARLGDRLLLAPAGVGGVRPHALQDARQLARQRHLRPLHAAAPGHLQGPPPEGRDAGGPGQHRVRGLVQRGAHRRVPDLADPAGHVGLARPAALRREPEVRPDRLGGPEPCRIIDRGLERDRDQGPHARHRHQPAADRVAPDDGQHPPAQAREPGPQALARPQHRADDLFQHLGPAAGSSTLAANRPLLTSPTLSPKPRSRPRMLSSTSRSLVRNSLRPASSALISCAGGDSRCTGRYQPILSSWPMPRASLRSVSTTIAESAALTCRVSSSTASNPASPRPAWSHRDKGPASSPTRVSGRPSCPKKATSASGTLATLASRTIRPVPSTTHTLLRSSETSIPAWCSTAVPR